MLRIPFLALVTALCSSCYKFKPKAHNPYFVINYEEEEAAVEALKFGDEFEF